MATLSATADRVIDGTNGRYVLTCQAFRAGPAHKRRTIREWTVVRHANGVREPIGTRPTLAGALKLVESHE